MKAARKLSLILIALLLVLMCCGVTAGANSAWFEAEGTDSAGVVVLEGECPLVVTGEHLVFDIQELPEIDMDITDTDAYSASVTAEYTFYNPTDLNISASLVFPFDAVPSYAAQADPDAKVPEASDLDGWNILVDGSEAERRIRYTYYDVYERGLDLQEQISGMSDSYLKDDFFDHSTPVTIITYRASGSASVAEMSFSDPGRCRVMPYSGFPGSAYDSDSGVCTLSFDANREFSVCVFGDAGAFSPRWVFKNGEGDDGNGRSRTRPSVSEVSRQTFTFYELAISGRPSDSAVPVHEWYNAVLMKLREKIDRSPGDWCIIEGDENLWDIEDEFLRWYQYDLEVGPRQTVVNTVEAPIYPRISGGHQFLGRWSELPGFDYTYLLSPAQSWADFGQIRIDINTPYMIDEFSLEGFEETDSGYSATLEGLPDGELTFFVIEPGYEDEAGRGHCYIATCVYGDYDAPEVRVLRRFRDEVLDETPAGRAFIAFYYAVSPGLVDRFGDSELFKGLCRQPLDVMVGLLRAAGI